MQIRVLTIFPEMFAGLWSHGIVRRAIEQGVLSAQAINIRDFTVDRHHTVDDRPYGGGSGMVMKPEPLAAAIRHAQRVEPNARTILMSPQGRVFNQVAARELACQPTLILVCGRYEGVDDRLCHQLITDEISIGDYVLTGGEIAAMTVIDAVTRLIPGVLGSEDSAERDSFSDGLLEHPHYTRPPVFEGSAVPEVLLSGHHSHIEQWRLEASLLRTLVNRSDLLGERTFTTQETEILRRWHHCLGKLLSGLPPATGRKPG
jgi:tRNA (guanine37-N1)-methyltransferase